LSIEEINKNGSWDRGNFFADEMRIKMKSFKSRGDLNRFWLDIQNLVIIISEFRFLWVKKEIT
jgi:hypothetical protein